MKTALAFLALLASASPSCLGTPIVFDVTVDTAPLTALSGGAPYSLDFQLIGGDPIANTAVISSFAFGAGGSAVPGTESLAGLAAGSLLSAVSLGDDPSDFFNEFFQEFIPGSSLSFVVSLTDGVNRPNPDAFSFQILDNQLNSIPTDNFGDALLLVNIDSALPTVETFAGSGAYSGILAPTANVVATVEDSDPRWILFLAGILPVLAMGSRKIRPAG